MQPASAVGGPRHHRRDPGLELTRSLTRKNGHQMNTKASEVLALRHSVRHPISFCSIHTIED